MALRLLQDEYSEASIAELFKTVESDLAFLWNKHKVSPQLQAKFAEMDITNMSVFAKIEPDEDALRQFLKTEVGILADFKGAKTHIAKVLSAWETAKIRGTKRKQEEAEQRATDKRKRMTQSEHTQLLRAYNDVHDELRQKEAPSTSLH